MTISILGMLRRRAKEARSSRAPGPADGAPERASAETVVRLCAEAKVDRLASILIERREPLPQVRQRIKNASDVRDICAAAGFPHLTEQAIESLAPAGLLRSLFVDATAAASADEINHHLPEHHATGDPDA